MVKTHVEIREIEKEITDDIICNKCGKPIHKHIFDNGNHIEMDDCLSVKQAWGYFSNYDEEEHSFEMCQDCYEELKNSFVIPVKISHFT
jgi:protein-arginine kinase activator protein McsA